MTNEIKEKAHEVLDRNTQSFRKGGREYTFSVPSLLSYPFQWFWDSCFHAIVWTHFDLERAKEEIIALLSAQHDDGFIPHIIFWDQSKVRRVPWLGHYLESKGRFSFLPFFPKPKTTELIQPPVIAQSVIRIWQTAPERSHEFLLQVVPKLNRYFTWLATSRDPDQDHLLTITAPYESGMDQTPAYDAELGLEPSDKPFVIRWRTRRVTLLNALLFNYNQARVLKFGPFHVEDVLVNAIYALNLDILSDLNRIQGNHEEERKWREESLKVTNALIRKCWDSERGAFFNLNGRKERRSTVLTIASIFPLILPWLPKHLVQALIDRHLTNPTEFWLPYPVPSVAANEPTFSPDSEIRKADKAPLWRGPTWINTNWFIVHALKQHGYEQLANQITIKSRELIERGGFREYYHPYTGEPIADSAQDFSWSTLIVDF